MSARRKDLFSIIEVLKAEHQEILKQMAAIEASDILDEVALAKLFHFVQFEHHPKEEEELFPAVAQSPCLKEGGPRCGYFMGLRLDFDQLPKIRSRLQDFTEKSGIPLTSHKIPDWLTPQNPLSIPMEEHDVAHLLVLALSELMKTSNLQLKEEFFDSFLRSYFKLLKLHIQKEDTCLFIQCAKACGHDI